MQNKSTRNLRDKSLLFFIFSVTCFLSTVTARAQSVVGKWKEQTDMEYFSSDKHSQPHPPFNGKFQLLEIKADKTFTSTEYMNWIPGEVAVAGDWSLTGDQLKTKTNNVNVDYAINTYTMKLDQDMLVLTLTQPKGSHVSMVEKRYKKM